MAKTQKAAAQQKRICPACESEAGFLLKAKDNNRKLSDRYFSYYRCENCGLVFLGDIPENLGDFYAGKVRLPGFDRIKKAARHEAYQLKMVTRYVKSGRLLEVGPGYGIFAYQAKESGFIVDAIEQDREICEYLKKFLDLDAINEDSPHKSLERLEFYEAIVLWQVIEHLPEPFEFLKIASRKIKPGGILLLSTPNPLSFQLKAMRSFWPHIDAPRHINLFPPEMLKKYLEALGMREVFFSCSDQGAKGWNIFGWQRLLMNFFGNGFMQKPMFILGYFLGVLMSPFDGQAARGASYTLIFQKR